MNTRNKSEVSTSDLFSVGDHVERIKTGVHYKVTNERNNRGCREIELTPIRVPDGKRARKTWKWDQSARREMVIL